MVIGYRLMEAFSVTLVQVFVVALVVIPLPFIFTNRLREDVGALLIAAVLAVAQTLGLGVLGSLWAGLAGVLIGQALAVALSAAVALGLLRRDICLAPSREALRKMLAFSLPLVPAGAASFVAFYGNRGLLSTLAGLEQVGLYAVAARIASSEFPCRRSSANNNA